MGKIMAEKTIVSKYGISKNSVGKSIIGKSILGKRYRGGSDTVTGESSEKKTFWDRNPFISGVCSFFLFILKLIIGIFMFIVLLFILFACAAVMALFVGSYIMLEYFLKAVNLVFINGINGIIKFVMLIASIFVPPKKAKKMKKSAKLKKIPTDPSVLVLRALGIKPLKDKPEQTTSQENDEEEECSEEDDE